MALAPVDTVAAGNGRSASSAALFEQTLDEEHDDGLVTGRAAAQVPSHPEISSMDRPAT
jgi:hypothetical protein